MRKIAIVVLCISFLGLAGCANDDYAIERSYYRIFKQAEKIFKNPDASPPNELTAVVSLLDSFAKDNPKNILSLDAQFTIARLYIVKKGYDKARQHLNRMLSQYKNTPPIASEVIYLIGNSYEIQDNWGLAKKEYEKAYREYPLTLRGLSAPIYIGQYYKIKHQPEDMMQAYRNAVEHYKNLYEKYKDFPAAYTFLQLKAQCYLELKEWKSALDTFDTILVNYGDKKYKNKMRLDSVLMNSAGIYIKQLKDNAKAKEYLIRLINEYPKSQFVKLAKDLLKELNSRESKDK